MFSINLPPESGRWKTKILMEEKAMPDTDLAALTSPDMILVQRADLMEEVSLIDSLMTYAAEFVGVDLPYHNRLKAALEGK